MFLGEYDVFARYSISTDPRFRQQMKMITLSAWSFRNWSLIEGAPYGAILLC